MDLIQWKDLIFVWAFRKVDGYNYFDLRKNDKWAAIMISYLSHDKEDTSSVLVQMEITSGYTRVVYGGLKITNSNFKKSMNSLIHYGIIAT